MYIFKLKKNFPINWSPQASYNYFKIKKGHKNPTLADNYPFQHCESLQSVAEANILFKKIATVQMD